MVEARSKTLTRTTEAGNGIPEPLDKLIVQAFNQIVTDLRSNWRVPQPTKFERVLGMFRSAGDQGLTLEEISSLYQEALDPDNAARTALGKLNAKLESFGLRIERPKTFHVVQFDPSETK